MEESQNVPLGKMLITGASGLLGGNLAEYFKTGYRVWGIYHRHPIHLPNVEVLACDLTDPISIRDIVASLKPDIVIHCAALADVDLCEKEPHQAYEMNVAATRNLVGAIPNRSTRLIYISTDSVYDGTSGAFSEKDPVRPCNVYGRTKFEGELEALKRERALILRTNFFGRGLGIKKSLAEWVLNQLRDGIRIKGFTDAIFSPLYTGSLAEILARCLESDLSGIYNCGGADCCSKYEFALKIAHAAGLDEGLITPVSVDEFDFIAPRGKNLSLDSSRLQDRLETRFPGSDESIGCFLEETTGTSQTESARSIL